MVYTAYLAKTMLSVLCIWSKRAREARAGMYAASHFGILTVNFCYQRGSHLTSVFKPLCFLSVDTPPLCTRSCILMLVAVSTVQNSYEKPPSRQCPCCNTPFTLHSLVLKTPLLFHLSTPPRWVFLFFLHKAALCAVVCLSWWWPGGHSVFYALSLWWPSVGTLI